MMNDFVRVAGAKEIPDPGKLTVEVGDRLVVVVHVQGQFYCIDDVCTHDGGPLGEGRLCDFEIACPRHGAKLDRKSTRLNSSHGYISYAVFCLKKKKINNQHR